MALVGNYSALNKNAGRLRAGSAVAGASAGMTFGNWQKNGAFVNFALQDKATTTLYLVGFPLGYAGWGWKLPIQSGEISGRKKPAHINISPTASGAMGMPTPASATITINASSSSVRVGTPGSGTITFSATCSSVRVGTPGAATISISVNGVPTSINYIVGSSDILISATGGMLSIAGAVGSCTFTLSASAISYALGYAAGTAAAQISASANATAMINAPGSATISLTAEAISKAIGHLVGDSDLEMTGEIISYALGWIAGNTIDVITAGITPEAVARAVMNSTIGGTLTLEQAVRATAAVLTGKSSGGGTGTIIFRDAADTKDTVIATMDANKNRTNVILDLD